MKHMHHIIPKHAGGSDDPTNLISLTPEEHAAAHKKLYEEYGRWQDYVAWQGLAKLATKKDLISQIIIESNKSRKGTRRPGTGKAGGENGNAKEYLVTYPTGETIKIKSLRTWCNNNNLNYNSLHKACISKHTPFNGYMAVKC
jgi:hypothetical protein